MSAEAGGGDDNDGADSFTVGMAKKAALEATAMAHIDAKATSSRAEGLRRSNEIKNGTHAAIIITNAEM